MGGVLGKRRAGHPYKKSNDLKQRIRLLEDELLELRCKRGKESGMHEHEARLFMGKEAKWKRERKRWREEVKRLKSRLEEKDEVIEMLEERRGGLAYTVKDNKAQWQLLGATVLVEQMREEQALREEAVEKWKGLYLAIKAELDDLILRTHHGKMLFLKNLLAYASDIRIIMLRGSSCLDGPTYSAVESLMKSAMGITEHRAAYQDSNLLRRRR